MSQGNKGNCCFFRADRSEIGCNRAISNILQTEDLAITFQIARQSQKKLVVGDPQIQRYQKVQFLL